MATLFTYSTILSVMLITGFVSFRLSRLDKRKPYTTSRVAIIGIYIISLASSAIVLSTVNSAPISEAAGTMINIGNSVKGSNALEITRILLAIWIAGCTLALVMTIISIVKIIIMIVGAERTKAGKRNLYITDRPIAPFSFGPITVINRNDYNGHAKIILSHEEGHIRMGHTYDILIAQACLILCWYNPAAWILRNDLKAVHEFQADEYAIRCGNDIITYQMFLIMNAARSTFPSIASNLNKNKLKRRIAMMQSGRSRISPVRTVIAALLLAAGFFILISPRISASLGTLEESMMYADNQNPSKSSGSDEAGNRNTIKIVGVKSVEKKVNSPVAPRIGGNKKEVVYELDGKRISNTDLQKISPDRIKSITVEKSGEENMVKIYLKK